MQDNSFDEQPQQPHRNGNNNGAPPSISELMVQQLGKPKDIVREMVTAEVTPETFLQKGVLDNRERKAVIRFMWSNAYLEDDENDDNPLERLTWTDYNMGPAVNGRARDEVVSMVTGKPNGIMPGMAAMFGRGKRRRTKDLSKNEWESDF